MPKFRFRPRDVTAVQIQPGMVLDELAPLVASGEVSFGAPDVVFLETESIFCDVPPGWWVVWVEGEPPALYADDEFSVMFERVAEGMH